MIEKIAVAGMIGATAAVLTMKLLSIITTVTTEYIDFVNPTLNTTLP